MGDDLNHWTTRWLEEWDQLKYIYKTVETIMFWLTIESISKNFCLVKVLDNL